MMIVEGEHLREMSPGCLSRESSGGPRCPSNESVYSGRSGGGAVPGLPIGLAGGAAAAAALLPHHSAAVAAYLGAAAAAAQHQHRLLMAASPRPSSPGSLRLSHTLLADPDSVDVLDFSTKKNCEDFIKAESDDSDVMNLSKTTENSPLDLSVTNRKRTSDDAPAQPPVRKSSRSSEYKPIVSPWTTPVAPHLPYFAAAVAAAGLSPKNNNISDWNGKLKHSMPTPNDATKALEKMSELSRLGGEELFRTVAQGAALGANIPGSAAGRHSAWQSHWLNKGAEQAKDVLKCVWCKKSFATLADMTIHMKEAKHCGVNVPIPPGGSPSMNQLQPPASSPSTQSNNSSNSSNNSKPNQNDLNLLIKETMPLPRKLVRGQDVWLGKGAEQTRQILKCMWCGQSFRSLAEMTSHMQQTQHYTNIISQEQIISWKSSDDTKGSSGGTVGSNSSGPSATGTSSHVSAVLTCKVCDQAFSSLKELSNHMVKNSHYKEHIMRSITESGGRRRQTREKRKKSLPVRKLLELERAQHEFKNGDSNSLPPGKPIRDLGAGSRITCEKCGDKIETAVFVEHIRQCVGAPITNSQRNFLKSALLSNNILPPEILPSRENRKSISDDIPSPGSRHHRSPSSNADLSPNPKENSGGNEKSSSPSVLNAIEQLIEKSFDTRSRHGNAPGLPGAPPQAPIGLSILKRLGIDESVDYTKPLVDPQTMNMLRNYHHHQAAHYARRERSGSESSSMSERGSSRVESLTPDRKMDPPSYQMTPRTTPDVKTHSQTERLSAQDETPNIKIKKEITFDDDRDEGMNLVNRPVRIKKEIEDDEDERPRSSQENEIEDAKVKRRGSSSTGAPSPRQQNSPSRNSSSPASDRSATPRSTPGIDKKPSGSLGALSSMFDSLSGSGNNNESASGSSKRNSSHPLAALQKLCDKTETHHPNHRSGSNQSSNVPSSSAASPTASGGTTTPGAILAFSWACNDAVMTADSIMKCAFCDTPFISKGAYRHHLSKMHFVKDGVIPDPVAMKAHQQPGDRGPLSPNQHRVSGGPSTPSVSSPQDPKSPLQSSFEESPHSKFLKYTELAKQLSSKYV